MRVRCSVLLFTLSVVAALDAGAQTATLDALVNRFVLDAVAPTAADLSADGKWLAATSATLRDRIGIDNSRFADPTYTAPSVAEVWAIETSTGRPQRIVTGKRQVRGLKWSPDASRLALFLLNGDLFEPAIWDRATATLRAIA